ncbi:hypothetical protein P6F26_03085 [Roseibacterium sp. SDUM158017]|uniref:hypothetical protein n=1 Tax=Roseicyclus salinarum TaxID=3036773 RepID=UPI002415846F|nr:hypothetical protein [Roseibacterium sp. SDUM158017]MDG4647417.1 hypothetical protein [Roseibacterium sp. SDUM158017]
MANRNRKTDPDEVLVSITPKPARRVFAAGVTGILGLILVYLAAAHPPADLVWLAFLVLLGALSLWWSWRVWQATGVVLQLTRRELREEGGRQLCAIDNVDRVDNSAFAFKPAAGFLVHLKEPAGRAYAPGLWWRAGRRVAVGGATARGEGKAVAELIKVMLAEREGGGR